MSPELRPPNDIYFFFTSADDLEIERTPSAVPGTGVALAASSPLAAELASLVTVDRPLRRVLIRGTDDLETDAPVASAYPHLAVALGAEFPRIASASTAGKWPRLLSSAAARRDAGDAIAQLDAFLEAWLPGGGALVRVLDRGGDVFLPFTSTCQLEVEATLSPVNYTPPCLAPDPAPGSVGVSAVPTPHLFAGLAEVAREWLGDTAVAGCATGSSGAASVGTAVPVRMLRRVDIINTHTLSSAPAKDTIEGLKTALGGSLGAEVAAGVHERVWPSGISTLSARNSRRSQLTSYVGFLEGHRGRQVRGGGERSAGRLPYRLSSVAPTGA